MKKNSCRNLLGGVGLSPVWFHRNLSPPCSLPAPSSPPLLPVLTEPCMVCFPSTTAQFVYLACLCLSLGQLLQWLQTPSLSSPQGDGCRAGAAAFLFTHPKCIHSLVLTPFLLLTLTFIFCPSPGLWYKPHLYPVL